MTFMQLLHEGVPSLNQAPVITPVKDEREKTRLSMAAYKNMILHNRISIAEAFPANFRNITSAKLSLAPKAPFSAQVSWYENDGDARLALDWTRNSIAGPGIYFTGSKDSLPVIEEFSKRTHLYQKIYDGIVFETIAYGNNLWWMKEANNFSDLNWLPISDFKRVWFEKGTGKLIAYDLRGTKSQMLPAEEVIHFTWGKSNSGIYGLGLLYALTIDRPYSVKVKDQFETRFAVSIMDAKSQILDESRLLIRRYVPRNIYKFPGATEKQLDANRSTLKVLEPGEDFVVGEGAEVQEMGSRGRVMDVESFMDLQQAEILKALQTPAPRIFTRPDFNRASSEAAIHLAKLNYRGYQTIMALEITSKIIEPWWRSHPDIAIEPWESANIELHWNPMDPPDPDPQFILGALESRGITLKEFRRNAENMGLELMKDTDAERMDPEEAPEMEMKLPGTEEWVIIRERAVTRASKPAQ